MFSRTTRSLLGLLIAATLGLVLVTPAQAVSYTWDNGGTGFWDTTDTNWGGSGSLTPWDSTNGIGNTATFNIAGATATVSDTVYTNGITFGDTATISGSTINLAGTTPTITANADATISSQILSDTAGLTKQGLGALTLSGSNTVGGLITSSAGTFTIASGGTLNVGGQVGQDNDCLRVTGGTLVNDGTIAAPAGAVVTVKESGTMVVTGTVNTGPTWCRVGTTDSSSDNTSTATIILKDSAQWNINDGVHGSGPQNGFGFFVVGEYGKNDGKLVIQDSAQINASSMVVGFWGGGTTAPSSRMAARSILTLPTMPTRTQALL
jgi:hypothetical protein